MILDEFLVAIGVKADTKKVEEMESAINGVEDAADSANQKTSSFGKNFSNIMKSIGTIVVAASAAIKTALAGAWAYFDGYIQKAEELYNSKDADVKITRQQYEMAQTYNKQMESMRKTIEGVRVKIAFAFLPTMLEMVNSVSKFIEENKELITVLVSGLLKNLVLVGNAINNVARFINLVIENTVGWKVAIGIVVVALAVLKRAMLAAFITNPIAWVVAALAGLILLIDDFMTYLDGGNSKFGEFWGALLAWIETVRPEVEAIWEYFTVQFENFIDVCGYLLKFLSAIFSGNAEEAAAAFVGMFATIGDMAYNMVYGLAKLWPYIWTALKTVFELAIAGFMAFANGMVSVALKIVDGIKGAFSTLYDVLTFPFRMAFEWISSKFSSIPNMLKGAVGSIGSAFGSIGNVVASGSKSVTNNNYGGSTATVNVNASGMSTGQATSVVTGALKGASYNTMGKAKA